MKKAIVFSIIGLILLASFFVYGCSSESLTADQPSSQTHESECSKGQVNDTYPGNCASYIDENNNGICDLSE